MEKNESDLNNEIEKIFEEGEKIYPISENSQKTDEKCDNLYKIENWAEVIYHLKEGKSKERFIELINNSEYSKFLEGLNYEYGINNCPLDLDKAFKIYKEAANNSMDSMSMFRMYHIYKNDFNKFNILKRNRILEKFYLFKCYSFSRYPLIDEEQNLFNRFDITYETKIHIIKEDEDLNLFHNFIKFLKINYKFYDINPNDLELIEYIIDYNFDDNANKETIMKNLEKMSDNNLEALYKLTCFTKDSNEEEKEKKFKLLYEKGYYRSYVDYALYLNKKNRYKEALEVLDEARKNGVIPAGYLYYDIYLENNDFSLLINEAVTSSFSKDCKLYNLFEILRDDILTESIYSFFEFIFLRKIFIKHYKLEKEFNNYFFDFTKEMVNFLVKITEEKNITKKKETIKKYYCKEGIYQELHLACGTLYYYGIENIIEKNYDKALSNFIESYYNSRSKSYKRFCYFYIYNISKRIYELNKPNNNNENGFNLISEDKIKNIEKKIFDMYYSSINENISNLSSSYFYYLSRLFHKKIGNNGDKILEYICLNRSNIYRNDSPGSGSVICIYRKYKTKLVLEKYKDDYNKEFNDMKIGQDSEGYGDDGSICPICFEFKRNEIALPCRHLFCELCLKKLNKCPICRRNILMKHHIG